MPFCICHSFCQRVQGELVWQTDYDIYGGLRKLKGEREFIPFRQLGQYEDEETGLYYNRFRYYDSTIGNYISQDPIGLVGGNPTLHGYVEDVNISMDLFGLKDFVTAILTIGDHSFKETSKTIHLPDGIFSDIVSSAKKTAILSDIEEGLDPKRFYGNCAEINVIQKALDSNISIEDLNGAKMYTYITSTGEYIPPCKCCQNVLDKLGIIIETNNTHNIKVSCH